MFLVHASWVWVHLTATIQTPPGAARRASQNTGGAGDCMVVGVDGVWACRDKNTGWLINQFVGANALSTVRLVCTGRHLFMF